MDERIDKLADQLATLVGIVSKKVVATPAPVKAVEESCVTCGGAHSWYNFPITDNNQPNVCAVNQKVVERETEAITNEEQNNFQGSTTQIPPMVIPISNSEPEILKTSSKTIPEPDVPRNLPKSTSIPEPDVPKTFPKPNISFAPTIRNLLMNKEKLLELAKIPLSENCSTMLLKKLPEKLGDPDPQVPLILGRSFLRTSRTLIDVYEGELILRDENEQIVLHVDGVSKQPHVNESIKLVNDTSEDGLEGTSNLSSGSTTSFSNPSPKSFETKTNEPTSVCSPPPGDDDNAKKEQEVKKTAEAKTKCQAYFTSCLKNFKVIQKGSLFSNKTPQVSSVFTITSIEPKDSLIMGDKHVSTSRVKEIVPILRESEDSLNNNKGCDLTFCDNDKIFSNPLFESNDDFSSSEDKSLSNENVPKENFKVYSNPLFNEEIISSKIKQHHFNSESDREILTVSYSKIDSLLEEFSDELAHIDLILPGINQADFDFKEDIRLIEELLYSNSSPRPPEVLSDHKSQNESDHANLMIFSLRNDPLHHDPNSIIESLPTPVEDSDPIQEEIDLFHSPDDLIPTSVENDDSEDDDNFTLENESSILDPSTPRPPPEPLNVCLNFKPNTAMKNDFVKFNEDFYQGEMNLSLNVEDDDSVTFVIQPFLSFFTYPEDSLLLLSFGSEDLVFDPGIFAYSFFSYALEVSYFP
ncbi:hypothetical protein Tco_0797042 [Tanacetum coccineum]